MTLAQVCPLDAFFCDDFNRAPGLPGNGWVDRVSNVVPSEIESNTLLLPNVGSELGVMQPLPMTCSPIRIQAAIEGHVDGNTGLDDRFDLQLTIGADDSDAGYGLGIHRSNSAFTNSLVGVIGGSTTNNVFSTFQFSGRVFVDFTVEADGSIAGTVSDLTDTFGFNFPPDPAIATHGGSNFLWASSTSPIADRTTGPRLDDVVITVTADAEQTTLWQIGRFNGAVDPIVGSSEYPATDSFFQSFTYTAAGIDPQPHFPGYLADHKLSDVLEPGDERPLTDSAKVAHISFSPQCSYEVATLVYDRYGSEVDELRIDGSVIGTVSGIEGQFESFLFDLGSLAAGNHALELEYLGGGDQTGHYVDAVRLEVSNPIPFDCVEGEICDDGLDNDTDGLVDFHDPECILRYVAGGDSIAFGDDLPDAIEPHMSVDPQPSPSAYPALFGDSYLKAKFPSVAFDPMNDNIACPGTTSAQFLATDPCKTNQLSEIVRANPSLITLTIGANDVLDLVTEDVEFFPFPPFWFPRGFFADLFFDALDSNISTSFDLLTRDTNALVVVTTVYNPIAPGCTEFDEDALPPPWNRICGPIKKELHDLAEDFIAAVNAIIKARAAEHPTRVFVADLVPLFRGHEFGTPETWIAPLDPECFVGLLDLAGLEPPALKPPEVPELSLPKLPELPEFDAGDATNIKEAVRTFREAVRNFQENLNQNLEIFRENAAATREAFHNNLEIFRENLKEFGDLGSRLKEKVSGNVRGRLTCRVVGGVHPNPFGHSAIRDALIETFETDVPIE